MPKNPFTNHFLEHIRLFFWLNDVFWYHLCSDNGHTVPVSLNWLNSSSRSPTCKVDATLLMFPPPHSPFSLSLSSCFWRLKSRCCRHFCQNVFFNRVVFYCIHEEECIIKAQMDTFPFDMKAKKGKAYVRKYIIFTFFHNCWCLESLTQMLSSIN